MTLVNRQPETAEPAPTAPEHGRRKREKEPRFTKKHKIIGGALVGTVLAAGGWGLLANKPDGNERPSGEPVPEEQNNNPDTQPEVDVQPAETEINPLNLPENIFDNPVHIGLEGDPGNVYPANTAFEIGNTGWNVYIGDAIAANDIVAEYYGPDYSPHRSIADGSTSYVLMEVGGMYTGDESRVTYGMGGVFVNIDSEFNFTYQNSEGEVAGTNGLSNYPNKFSGREEVPAVGQVFSGYVLHEVDSDALASGHIVVEDTQRRDLPEERFDRFLVQINIEGDNQAPSSQNENLPPAESQAEEVTPETFKALDRWDVTVGEMEYGKKVDELVERALGPEGNTSLDENQIYIAVPFSAEYAQDDAPDHLLHNMYPQFAAINGSSVEDVGQWHSLITPDEKDEFMLPEGAVDLDNYEATMVFVAEKDALFNPDGSYKGNGALVLSTDGYMGADINTLHNPTVVQFK